MEDCLYVMVISMDYSKFLLGKLFFNFKSAISSFLWSNSGINKLDILIKEFN